MDQENENKITAYDGLRDNGENAPTGVAYYRIPVDFKNFLTLCERKHGIVGFEYTIGELNFGVIINQAEKPAEIPAAQAEESTPAEETLPENN